MKTYKLSKSDIEELYAFLYQYEHQYKSKAGSFDRENDILCKYLKDNSIFLGAMNNNDRKQSTKYRFYILYDQRANLKVSGKDKVHHLLRHIRNSFAHGLIHKGSKNILSISDKNMQGKETMSGSIELKTFLNLINCLVSTRKVAD